MGFFKNIEAMQVQGDWVICIKQKQAGTMTVSVLFKDENCGDAARKLVPPLIFSDKNASDIDDRFFTELNETLPETAKLFSSMEHYLKQREEARKHSQMEKDKGAKEKKALDEKRKKYEATMKKVDELEAERKYKEAWMKVPEPTDYPDFAETIRKRKNELSKKFAPDMFATKDI